MWLYREEPVEIGCDVVLAIGKPRVSPLLSLNSQCRLIPYLHQRPIFFKTNSSIVVILELTRGAQCLIEMIRSSGEEMWRVDAYQIPYYSRGIEGEKRTHPRFAYWPVISQISESSSNGSYRNTDEVWWRYGISRSCDKWSLASHFIDNKSTI
jgi:hypothetical protein